MDRGLALGSHGWVCIGRGHHTVVTIEVYTSREGPALVEGEGRLVLPEEKF